MRVIKYAQALVETGASVDVIALRQPGQNREEVVDGVNVIRVQSRERNERTKLTYLWRILAFFFRSAWMLGRRQGKSQYELVHVHSVPDFEVFAAVVPKLRGAKLILDIHDIVPEFYSAKFGKKQGGIVFRLLVAIERLSARFADHVIIANELWRQRLVQRSVPDGKCTSIINFPDTSIFKPGMRTRLPNGGPLLMYPGSLNHHQGLDIAITAMKAVRDELPGARFEIYGDGPEREKLSALVQKLELEECVKILPPRPTKEIAVIMANADLAIVPKRDDPFGGDAFSTKILEFMALGVPLVVADTRIDRHYFDETLVRFFRSGDAVDLGRQIVRAIREEAETERRVVAASCFAEQNTWNKKKSVYLDLVQQLTGT